VNGLIVMAGNYAFRVVISRQLGTAELGLYFLAAQLAFLPAEAAREIVGTVAFPLFARLQTDVQRAAKTFRMVLTGLSIILFPMCSMLIVFAPELVQYVLGAKWDGTVPVIQVLALVSMIGTFGEVAVPIFNGFGYPNRITMIEVVQSTIIISLVWVLTTQFGLAGAAFAWLPTVIVSQVVGGVLVSQILPRPLAGLGTPFLFILLATGACALVGFGAVSVIPGLVGAVIAIVLATLTFIGFLWGFDRRFELGFVENVTMIFPQLSGILTPTSG
jgi:O-antigen/teichoic acid export membrane protein